MVWMRWPGPFRNEALEQNWISMVVLSISTYFALHVFPNSVPRHHKHFDTLVIFAGPIEAVALRHWTYCVLAFGRAEFGKGSGEIQSGDRRSCPCLYKTNMAIDLPRSRSRIESVLSIPVIANLGQAVVIHTCSSIPRYRCCRRVNCVRAAGTLELAKKKKHAGLLMHDLK